MPCWYYEPDELKATPSYLDGVSAEDEKKFRADGARFITDLSLRLKLGYDTSATATITAACCLMLAGKVEETPKKARDIIYHSRNLLPPNEFVLFGSSEQKALLETTVQNAWGFINDSFSTTLCLQWEPEIVGCVALYLATKIHKFKIEDWEGRTTRQRWWECFVEGLTISVMDEISHKILDVYSQDQSVDVTPFEPQNKSVQLPGHFVNDGEGKMTHSYSTSCLANDE